MSDGDVIRRHFTKTAVDFFVVAMSGTRNYSRMQSGSVFSGRRMPERGLVPARTFSLDIASPINALSKNKDGSMIVVAGRTVFKTLKLCEDKFEELLNLRVGRMNLTFSSTDVQWHPLDANLIATSATNGAVVLWNLGKLSKSKQLLVYNDHKRTTHKVAFPPDGSYLLSGSQDGSVKLFDIRVNQKECQMTFNCGSDSIRDVQVNPMPPHNFATAGENGMIKTWDKRNPSYQVRGIQCHNGPAFACHWHPEECRYLATAGRDKMIKIWDMQESSRQMFSIQTIASVARIKWRPKHKWHIGSCSLLVENSINVWDVNRRYIPYATFTEHKDVTTSFEWLNENVVLSGSKDGTLIQHAFKDAERPADTLPPVGMALNIRGDITYASCDSLMMTAAATTASNSIFSPPGAAVVRGGGAAFFKKQPENRPVDKFLSVRSTVLQFKCPPKIFDFTEEVFRHLAKSYWIHGHSLEEICDHNASKAMEIQRFHIAKTWAILKRLYAPETSSVLGAFGGGGGGGTTARLQPLPLDDATSVGGNLSTHGSKLLERRSSVDAMSKKTAEMLTVSTEQEYTDDDDDDDEDDEDMHGDRDDDDDDVDDDDDESGTESDGVKQLQNIASGADFKFDDDEYEMDSEAGSASARSGAAARGGRGSTSTQTWGQLPSEAFEPRHELQSSSPSSESGKEEAPDQFLAHSGTEHPTGGSADRRATSTRLISPVKDAKTDTSFPFLPKPRPRPPWDHTPIVVKMLHHFANQGDVQMSVSIILALGNKLETGAVDELILEQWFLSYVELLQRFQMCSKAALVIKLCRLQSVNNLNLDSTLIPSNCNACRKPLTKTGWFCDRCLSLTNSCSLCHTTVKGLYVWCQGCGHGGHLAHMRAWFAQCAFCPTGCGHRCECA